MTEDKIKEAFAKAKQDIFSLHSELRSLKQEIQQIKRTLEQHLNRQTDTSTHSPSTNSSSTTVRQTHTLPNTTIRHINPAENSFPTQTSTHNYPLETVKSPNSEFSTGNERVSTDRQTDRQTDNSTGNQRVKVRLIENSTNKFNNLEKASEIINSLDDIKKELRQKIKRLTKQEMLVFTTIYQLQEENQQIDYFTISEKLNLTESSIRDYVGRIKKKGLPIQKTKENNKKVLLSMSEDLKKIASLSTIIKLRDI